MLEAEEAKVEALHARNKERLVLLSGEQQTVARQGATECFREDRDWQCLYDTYRIPIERAAVSAADWDALPRALLPKRLEKCLTQALDALDKDELPVPHRTAIHRWQWTCTDPLGRCGAGGSAGAKWAGIVRPEVEPVQVCAS